ncbi:hypothetical protein B9L19_02770 [Geobacillus thermocatenulatus]|uniref:Transposase DDE domain-containing protein n=1 Tax=Geobacillus thermocatenulatus TaxID=33938 RepID=A0AA91TEH3_9BACL|nr:hypothetical protein B9L19_02770 [Geobacillus thermocatenulatus]
MQEHFHFTTDRVKLPKQYASILLFVSAQRSYNLGDKGYISQKLQKKLYEEHRVAFGSPRFERTRFLDLKRHWMVFYWLTRLLFLG